MKTYQLYARYKTADQWGEWIVGVFHSLSDAEAYMTRTISRYRAEYKHTEFDMKAVEITEKQGDAWNTRLNSMLD